VYIVLASHIAKDIQSRLHCRMAVLNKDSYPVIEGQSRPKMKVSDLLEQKLQTEPVPETRSQEYWIWDELRADYYHADFDRNTSETPFHLFVLLCYKSIHGRHF